MAYVRSKTINGKTYRYLVKSVRNGKRVRQVFVSYIGNPSPASSGRSRPSGTRHPQSESAGLPDFTPLTGPDVRADYVSLLTRLGVPVGGV